MSNYYIRRFSIVVLLLWSVAAHAADKAAPVLELLPNGVAISGATPGGAVAVFIVGRQPIPYGVRTIHDAVIVQADNAGRARHDWPQELPSRTIVAIADIESGTYRLGMPEGSVPHEQTLPPSAFRRNGEGYDLLSLQRPGAEVLIVRGGKGAWLMREIDGGEADADHRSDGTLRVAADRLQPLGAYERLTSIHNKDVIIVIDPQTLEVIATEVTP